MHYNLFYTFMASILSANVCGLRSHKKIDSFFTSVQADIVCLQETKWDLSTVNYVAKKWRGDIHAAHGTVHSCGVAILFKEDRVSNVECVYKDNMGRIIITDFKLKDQEYRIINVYASNKEAERKKMFKDIEKWCVKDYTIIGDFNVTLTKSDISRNNTFKGDISRAALLNLMHEQNLIDVWRMANPNKNEFSRRQIVLGKLKQSRVDLCLAPSNLVKKIQNIKYTFGTWSDHARITFHLGHRCETRGGGVWALNSSLIKEKKFREKIIRLINNITEEMAIVENMNEWWDEVKLRLKKACINYSKQKKWLENMKEKELREQMNNEIGKMDTIPDYNGEKYIALKTELDDIERNRCRGAVIRSRVKDILEGEKCTAYFLGLEKQKQSKLYINQLTNENGETVSNLEDILEITQKYYKNLFTRQELDRNKMEEALETIDRKITEHDREWCDAPFTLSEVEQAIDGLNKNKSPGIDGLTSEFYGCFKKQLAPILLKLYSNIEIEQETPDSLTTGLITLIYKNKGENNKLENYRPISLLNADYKILTKIIANRLKTIIGTIISSSQAYSIPGRDITDIIHSVKDTVNKMTLKGGILLGVDLNKAFDRVEHEFLLGTIEKFGFGERFIKWIRLLYKNAKSRIKCNGALTKEIALERSVRQGCPLSSLLYSLVAEPLALLVKKDKGIQGFNRTEGEQVKIFQYADDINIMVKDERSIEKVITHLKTYELASGSKVNYNKSEIMYCGNVEKTKNRWGFREAKEELKILGIYVGKNEEIARDKSWAEIVKKMNNRINLWRARGLRLRGKVTVINALVLSLINHVLKVYDLPNWALRKINDLVSTFLWKGKSNLVSQKTMILNKKEGGLGLVDVLSKMRAFRVQLLGKFLDKNNQYAWKERLAGCLASYGEGGILNLCRVHTQSALSSLPAFYKEVLEAWGMILPHLKPACANKQQVLQLPFLGNPFFAHQGRVLTNCHLAEAGVIQLKHIFNSKGIIDHLKVLSTLKMNNVAHRKKNILSLLDKVEQCVLPEWRELMRRNQHKTQDDALKFLLCLDNQWKNITEIATKHWYNFFRNKVGKRPASEEAWKRVFPNHNIPNIWKNLGIKHSNQQLFNTDFKIRHRRIFTGIVLHQINKNKYNRECSMCGLYDEDIEHIFLHCPCIVPFRQQLKTLLMDKANMKQQNNTDWNWTTLFGVREKDQDRNIELMNVVLAFARYATFIKRNSALYDKRTLDVWKLFSNMITTHIQLLWTAEMDTFESAFVDKANLCVITEDNKLKICFC